MMCFDFVKRYVNYEFITQYRRDPQDVIYLAILKKFGRPIKG
jgi:hypothetical protein